MKTASLAGTRGWPLFLSLKILPHCVLELLQEQLFEVADIVLLVKQDDAFLVLDFVHAPVGEGAVVVGQQNGVAENA